jgi:GNAT superfamily N-acetyltransferase
MSEIARSIGEQRPHIIVACCNVEEAGLLETDFPTIIQLSNYSPSELESAAELLFGKPAQPATTGPKLQSLMVSPKAWPVEVWNGNRDSIDGVYELWLECMPRKFYLGRFTLQSLLKRDGYAMHYVVREPETREILGFCATYTTYISSGGESLIGSLSVILVRPSYRQRGVGLSLHNHALRQLTKTRGVDRLQLGSTFPRLLFGLPVDGASDEWFRRRGWRMDQQGPGAGQEVCDWLLRISDWQPRPFPTTPGLAFRACDLSEFDRVLDMVERESARNDNVGWYDQYAKLANTMNVRDIVIGIENETIVATALTFVKNTGSPVAEDIPWPSAIGDDVGGVTCICITGT